MSVNYLLLLTLFIYGTVAGSFSGALVYRLRHKKNIIKGRSFCESCKKTLNPIDLVPIVSWLFLKGKCRYCKKKTPIIYPVFELICGLVFVFNGWLWPFGLSTYYEVVYLLAWLLMVANLFSISLYDFLYQEIPAVLQRLNQVIGLILFGWGWYFNLLVSGGGADSLLGSGLLFTIFWAIHYYSKGKWLGGADVILIWPFALILGVFLSVISVTMASYLALIIVGIVFVFNKKLTRQIPFGPFLAAGFMLCFLLSEQLHDFIYKLFEV